MKYLSEWLNLRSRVLWDNFVPNLNIWEKKVQIYPQILYICLKKVQGRFHKKKKVLGCVWINSRCSHIEWHLETRSWSQILPALFSPYREWNFLYIEELHKWRQVIFIVSIPFILHTTWALTCSIPHDHTHEYPVHKYNMCIDI